MSSTKAVIREDPWPMVRVYYQAHEVAALWSCRWILDGMPQSRNYCSAGIDYWMLDKWGGTSGLCAAHLAQLRQLRPEWIARISTSSFRDIAKS